MVPDATAAMANNLHFIQREINRSSEERRSNGDADDLQEEAVEGEWVLPDNDAAPIADDLTDAAERHASHVPPGLVADPLRDVDEHREAK